MATPGIPVLVVGDITMGLAHRTPTLTRATPLHSLLVLLSFSLRSLHSLSLSALSGDGDVVWSCPVGGTDGTPRRDADPRLHGGIHERQCRREAAEHSMFRRTGAGTMEGRATDGAVY